MAKYIDRRVLIQLTGLTLFLGAIVAYGFMGRTSTSPPRVAAGFDTARYLGRWYEIAANPIAPQRGCVGTTATYGLNDDGTVSVDNRCHDLTFDGELRGATARAWAPNAAEPAKLLVRFVWPFRAQYWVVYVDPDYTTAVVSNERRSNLWILHREPCLPQAAFDEVVVVLVDQGFDLHRLQSTQQRDVNQKECRVVTPAG